jgi:hypothetical protein
VEDNYSYFSEVCAPLREAVIDAVWQAGEAVHPFTVWNWCKMTLDAVNQIEALTEPGPDD